MPSNIKLLSDLINMEDAKSVCEEVRYINSLMYAKTGCKLFDEVFKKIYYDIVDLFRGKWNDYKSCNTGYHDLMHTTDVLLCFARLLHGAVIKKVQISEETAMLGLISALMHDTGYIQKKDDGQGTGGKYTLSHVERSVEFMKDYLSSIGCPLGYVQKCSDIIMATSLSAKVEEIKFESEEIANVAKMLAAADLVGQMADRVYLEKLLYLYKEFEEGEVAGFTDELDLLKKTVGFFDFAKKRISDKLDNVDKYLKYHFKARWQIKENLYEVAMKNNLKYLNKIINDSEDNILNYLKRGGIVQHWHQIRSA
ncbi:MAG: hypothetical protein EPN22_02765 [Nitrospirae bacterium]|nr:MAG: hypothetical protein EPN22_02765 [Nitrospirota bacterium]